MKIYYMYGYPKFNFAGGNGEQVKIKKKHYKKSLDYHQTITQQNKVPYFTHICFFSICFLVECHLQVEKVTFELEFIGTF